MTDGTVTRATATTMPSNVTKTTVTAVRESVETKEDEPALQRLREKGQEEGTPPFQGQERRRKSFRVVQMEIFMVDQRGTGTELKTTLEKYIEICNGWWQKRRNKHKQSECLHSAKHQGRNHDEERTQC